MNFEPNCAAVSVDLLGCRLEAVEDCTLQAQACLCYICAGNVEKLVTCWTRAQDRHCPLSLQVRGCVCVWSVYVWFVCVWV